MLPEPITHGGGGEDLNVPDDDDFTVSRIVPEHETGQFEAYAPTAAELGFDDSRYEAIQVPDDARALDPVGRSLMREERRAQLEASTGDRPEEQSYESSYQPQGYAEPQSQPQAYAQPQEYTYEANGYDTGAGAGTNGFQANGYSEHSYSEQPQPQPQGFEQYYEDPAAPVAPVEPAYQEAPSYQDDWPVPPRQPQGYDSGLNGFGYPEPQPADSSASSLSAPFEAPDSVGFERPGPSSSVSNSLTDAGLPRRDRGWPQSEQPAAPAPLPSQAATQPPAPVPARNDTSEWRSANDQNWQRAEQAREPKAGGVTPSGLPRRVPKANLVPGTAQQTPQSGPSVSRAPEDVRGRLSNLRRGVQQGRTAGTDTNGQGFGPNHQER
jgi:hypothetical protein